MDGAQNASARLRPAAFGLWFRLVTRTGKELFQGCENFFAILAFPAVERPFRAVFTPLPYYSHLKSAFSGLQEKYF
ncbi:MAG: hypothetical protein HDT27_07410 [Subdoligranulum sp.]|nr:hypothetical protein [Subdoligranulum sp.]